MRVATRSPPGAWRLLLVALLTMKAQSFTYTYTDSGLAGLASAGAARNPCLNKTEAVARRQGGGGGPSTVPVPVHAPYLCMSGNRSPAQKYPHRATRSASPAL